MYIKEKEGKEEGGRKFKEKRNREVYDRWEEYERDNKSGRRQQIGKESGGDEGRGRGRMREGERRRSRRKERDERREVGDGGGDIDRKERRKWKGGNYMTREVKRKKLKRF